jgi:hypothetical protein
VVTDALYSFFGGFSSARIAGTGARPSTLGLIIIFGEVMGLITMIALWKTVPHWFGFGLMLVYQPTVWLGARVRERMALASREA